MYVRLIRRDGVYIDINMKHFEHAIALVRAVSHETFGFQRDIEAWTIMRRSDMKIIAQSKTYVKPTRILDVIKKGAL